MKTVLAPYLNFMGKGKEAMEFYHSIFGGDLKTQTYGESGQSDKPEEKNFLMHGELKSEGITFFAADGNAEHQVQFGDNVHMSLVGDNAEELTDWFNKLAEGGTVDMPLQKQFWGDTFGMLTDKFGVHWMVNISSHTPQQ